VFYFSCACGCKVLFDRLDGDWPVHACSGYDNDAFSRTLARLQALFDEDDAEQRQEDDTVLLHPWDEQEYTEEDEEDEDDEEECATQYSAAPRAPLHRMIRALPETGGVRQGTGVVHGMEPADVAKALGLRATRPLGQGVLRQLGQGPWIQVTVHCGDLSNEDGSSYTCFVEERILRQGHVQAGDLVWFEVEAFGLPGGQLIWRCRAMEGV
jgi:hypothetical protein